jgi:adenylyltransferase/sulfurtransferase
LRSAKVLVVGAGALGNEIVKNLALLGVGTIVVVDLDVVENSNLARCVLFREEDQGKPKASLVCARAEELNPDVRAVAVFGDVRTLGLGAFLDADVVLGGLDNREARLFLNEACWKTTTPWVDGAIEGLKGVMRVFLPPDSACYESTLSDDEHEMMARRKSCTLLSREELETGKVPTTATSASVIAGLQVQEAVKLLHRDRLDEQFVQGGRGFMFNGMTHDSYVVTYATREDAMTRETLDLTTLEEVSGMPTFGQLVSLTERSLGARDAHIELQQEVIRSFACSVCDRSESVNMPASAVTSGAALCPTCGKERRLDLLHRISGADMALLELTLSDLGLPESDIVVGAAGTERCLFLVNPAGSPFRR